MKERKKQESNMAYLNETPFSKQVNQWVLAPHDCWVLHSSVRSSTYPVQSEEDSASGVILQC